MFEKLHDYTELLMPSDLLSENSIIADITRNITEEDCRDVEVIGWLYQFYISEKKEAIIGAKQKIKTEDIPAATQLFTPHWIVRYLVENSLGRLWMLNNPDSDLVSNMDYYIKPEEVETDFLKISSPEEIWICDPACGSGHMLTYAFDLLANIYEEQGYDKPEIPRLILGNNLYGMEIDQRAASLAAFALTMKAREYDHRFFRRGDLKPNILCLEKVSFEEKELEAYKDYIGEELYTPEFEETLLMFELADNAGSLLQPKIVTPDYYLQKLGSLDLNGNLELASTHKKALSVLKQTKYLAGKYHCVVANPPYMGNKNLNDVLKLYAKNNYLEVKYDLYAMFIKRIFDMVVTKGNIGLMTPFTWMFIKSYENLRDFLLSNSTLTSLVRPEYHSFFESAFVPICAFTLNKTDSCYVSGSFIDLQNFYGANVQACKALEAIHNPECSWMYTAGKSDFENIPGKPIAYWVTGSIHKIFENDPPLETVADARKGMTTSNDVYFIKTWNEVNINSIGFGFASRKDFAISNKAYAPINKGGGYRKWYGNYYYIGLWKNDGYEIRNYKTENGKLKSRPQNLNYLFKEGVTWNAVSVSKLSARYLPKGYLFNDVGPTIFNFKDNYFLLGYLHSKISEEIIKILCPTMKFEVGQIQKIPIPTHRIQKISGLAKTTITMAQTDWDSYETSWDFSTLPLLHPEHLQPSLKVTYTNLRQHWQEMTREMQRLEEENNRIFIEAYGLEDELTPDVPIEEITLTCNPHYRYSNNKSDEELESLLLADTMREFISYAVGCMFGRYSLDKPGLILANQGETLEDYIKKVGASREDLKYVPDEDNVIPITDGEYFEDDIVSRFKQFLKVTFGVEHYEENLSFLENAIGKDIRKYFLSDFYRHHVRMYRKRPIYWLFSSPKKTFNTLIYMHRYRPDTVSIVLNDYLREFIHKLETHINNLARNLEDTSLTSSGRGKLQKEVEELKKKVNELKDYEREVVFPLASERIEIDLDDGVKVNYAKFGKALASI
jgi:type II restriction/modification system DNA methylase subunit YeeA